MCPSHRYKLEQLSSLFRTFFFKTPDAIRRQYDDINFVNRLLDNSSR